jgi:hypothetical protein
MAFTFVDLYNQRAFDMVFEQNDQGMLETNNISGDKVYLAQCGVNK